MIPILTAIHIIVSFILILVVLLQTGKRADLAGAFGGGGSQTALGTRGAATVLSKITTASAVIFMITSLGLAILSSRRSSQESVLDKANIKQEMPVQTPAVTPTLPTETSPAGTAQPGEADVQDLQQEEESDSGDSQAP